jgi:hypothetical protein
MPVVRGGLSSLSKDEWKTYRLKKYLDIEWYESFTSGDFLYLVGFTKKVNHKYEVYRKHRKLKMLGLPYDADKIHKKPKKNFINSTVRVKVSNRET